MSGIAGTSARDTEVRLPRATKVKNKQPASQQVGPMHNSTARTTLTYISASEVLTSGEQSSELSERCHQYLEPCVSRLHPGRPASTRATSIPPLYPYKDLS